MTLFGVVAARIALWTWAGVALGLACRYSAAAPATCGVAIEVPPMVALDVSLEMPAETMSRPGAKRSTHVP